MNDIPPRPRRRAVSNSGEGRVTSGGTVTNGMTKEPVKASHRSLSVPADNPLPADPGYVSVGLGMTENLGNFESLRLDVRVTLPCGTSDKEVKAAKKRAAALVRSFIEEERAEALGTTGKTDKP